MSKEIAEYILKTKGPPNTIIKGTIKNIRNITINQIGGTDAETVIRNDSAVDADMTGDFFRSPGEHRYRFAQREHWDQPAAVSISRPYTWISGLLRSRGGCQLFLLRWNVLGFPER